MINLLSRTETIRVAIASCQPVMWFIPEGSDRQIEQKRIQGTASAKGWQITTQIIRLVYDDAAPDFGIVITKRVNP